jgi:very-short-patch-repair endonuclease
VHCFLSIPPASFPDRIWIRKYLEYIEKHGEINFYSIKLKPFDSYFEEELCNLLLHNLKKGYRIQNQVESCGFKIDFVISNTKNGKKLAIECDGPTHFQDELDEEYGIYVESDEERQRILESAGWTFYRIKYSDWINNTFSRNFVIDDITKLLN